MLLWITDAETFRVPDVKLPHNPGLTPDKVCVLGRSTQCHVIHGSMWGVVISWEQWQPALYSDGTWGQHPLVVQLKCSGRKKITSLRTSVGHLFHNFKDLFIEWIVLRFMLSGFDGLRFSRGRPWYKGVGTQSAGFWNSLMKGIAARDPDLSTPRAHSAVLHDGRMGNWDLKVPDLISKDLWQDL